MLVASSSPSSSSSSSSSYLLRLFACQQVAVAAARRSREGRALGTVSLIFHHDFDAHNADHYGHNDYHDDDDGANVSSMHGII